MSKWDELTEATGIADRALREAEARLRMQGLQAQASDTARLAELHRIQMEAEYQSKLNEAMAAQHAQRELIDNLLKQQAQRVSPPWMAPQAQPTPYTGGGSLTEKELEEAYKRLIGDWDAPEEKPEKPKVDMSPLKRLLDDDD